MDAQRQSLGEGNGNPLDKQHAGIRMLGSADEVDLGRRASFLATQGSFTLSAGSSRAGNDESMDALLRSAKKKTVQTNMSLLELEAAERKNGAKKGAKGAVSKNMKRKS